MKVLKIGESDVYTSKQGIEYHVQNKNGKLVMVKKNSGWGFKIQPASKEIKRKYTTA